jgi:hypothetical protein
MRIMLDSEPLMDSKVVITPTHLQKGSLYCNRKASHESRKWRPCESSFFLSIRAIHGALGNLVQYSSSADQIPAWLSIFP